MSSDSIKMRMTPLRPGASIGLEVIEEFGLNVAAAAQILGARRATLSDLLNGNGHCRPRWRCGSRKPSASAWTCCCGCTLGMTLRGCGRAPTRSTFNGISRHDRPAPTSTQRKRTKDHQSTGFVRRLRNAHPGGAGPEPPNAECVFRLCSNPGLAGIAGACRPGGHDPRAPRGHHPGRGERKATAGTVHDPAILSHAAGAQPGVECGCTRVTNCVKHAVNGLRRTTGRYGVGVIPPTSIPRSGRLCRRLWCCSSANCIPTGWPGSPRATRGAA